MSRTGMVGITAYYPNDPEGLLTFLEKHMKGADKETPVFLWVNNNDHKTSSQFYALRKLMRSGLKLHVYVNPPLTSEKEVFDFLATQVKPE